MRLQTTSSLFLLPALISAQSDLLSALITPSPELHPGSNPSLGDSWVPATTPTLPLAVSAPTGESTLHNDLRRQATGQGIATAATVATQMDPTMTLQLVTFVGGSAKQITVPFIQTFAPVPDQWPAAAVGTIGLGTIQGEVGIVKTKRDLPTQAPLANGADKVDADSPVADVHMLPEQSRTDADTGRGAGLEEAYAKVAGQQQKEETKVVENRSGKVVDSSAAGSALALILAIAAMVFA